MKRQRYSPKTADLIRAHVKAAFIRRKVRLRPHSFTGIFLKSTYPDAKCRGTGLNVSHCVFYKMVAVGFNTICYDARSVGVLNPPHE